jgi:hypothetical protein
LAAGKDYLELFLINVDLNFSKPATAIEAPHISNLKTNFAGRADNLGQYIPGQIVLILVWFLLFQPWARPVSFESKGFSILASKTKYSSAEKLGLVLCGIACKKLDYLASVILIFIICLIV